ncbi:hypothetical protein ACU639_37670 [Streptomyces cynarae]
MGHPASAAGEYFPSFRSTVVEYRPAFQMTAAAEPLTGGGCSGWTSSMSS